MIRAWRLSLERRLRRLPPLTVTREEAVRHALSAWNERVGADLRVENTPKALEELRGWTVFMKPGYRPIPIIDVDGYTGVIRGFHLPPM
ncbi:hypothetical protein EON81_25960 [bacterium]|nr:MAG: hypothetical protein EON81_25960 [bacterium]